MAYSYAQLEGLWIQYGGDPNAAAMAASIAMAESAGNPSASNSACNSAGTDQGLWQINSYYHSEVKNAYDIASNVKAAIQISNNGKNWQPWSTFNNGAWRKTYQNGVTPSGSSSGNVPVSQSTDNSGISLQNSTTAQFANSVAQPVLSIDMLKSQAPLVAALISSVPELQNIFSQAVAGAWSVDKFTASVQNSSWWATHSDTARQVFATMQADPATYTQTVSNLEAKLNVMASQLGASVSLSTMMQVATDALMGGYDTNEAILREKFSQYVTPVSGVHFGGEAGTDETTIRQTLRDLGITIDEGNLGASLKDIIAGKQSVQGVQSTLRTQAQATYPAYASLIQKGMNTSDIAAPYISRAGQLLEEGPGQMNIYSDMIKKALQYQVNGVPTQLPLNDFEATVRKDPRWQATDNARESTMSTAHEVLRQFGLAF
jgi:Lysozyme like domain